MGDAGGAGGNNMNIKQAKNEVKNTVKAYLSKDAHGEYVIPQIRQRPMLLIGPPGVGKTQIMEQIVREDMLKVRNELAHDYDCEVVRTHCNTIVEKYIDLFYDFKNTIDELLKVG